MMADSLRQPRKDFQSYGIGRCGCSNKAMRVLVVGCGYIGLPLAGELVRAGHEVFGINRSDTKAAELRALGIQPLTADITQARYPRRLAVEF